MSSWKTYETLHLYTIADMHQFIKDGITSINGGKFESLRMQTLLANPKCVRCKNTGNTWALQTFRTKSQVRTYHFNLWQMLHGREMGMRYVLMTRDHIIPASRNGAECLENSQTMCQFCNNQKSDTMPDIPYKEIIVNKKGTVKLVPLVSNVY